MRSRKKMSSVYKDPGWVHDSKISFEEISLKSTRRGTCSSCGRRTSRVFKVWQTLNPFNKNKDGVPKSRGEIYTELRVDLRIKTSVPLLCSGCDGIGKLVAKTVRGPVAGSA
jgi:hypothetical protein